MDCRQLYLVGFGLALLGSLATAGSLALAGQAAYVPFLLGGTVGIVFGLQNTLQREDFDRDHSLGYRVVNWAGAVFVVGLGVVMLAIAVACYARFG